MAIKGPYGTRTTRRVRPRFPASLLVLLFLAPAVSGCLGEGEEDRRLEVFDPEYCHPFYFAFQPENHAVEAVHVRLGLVFPDGSGLRLGLDMGPQEARDPMLWGVNESQARLYVHAQSQENNANNWTGVADIDAHPEKPHVWLVAVGTENGVTIQRTSATYVGKIDC